MPIDYKGLREFLTSGEKSPPPVFVGRQDIFKSVRQATRKNAQRGTQPGMTRIIQGAPGAGKSSLLEELHRHVDNAHVVILTTGEIQTPADILVPIARKLSERHVGDFLVRHSLTESYSVGMGPESTGFRFGRRRERHQVPEPTWQSLTAWAQTHGCLPDRPIILAIDETQRFRLEPDAPVAKVLQSVHDGRTVLPVVLVLAGLSDTVAKVRKIDLTRGSIIHEIKPLTSGETMELMSAFCDHFRIDSSRHLPQLKTLAIPCEGWPRHLHFTLEVLTRETLRTYGDMDRFDWIGMERQALDSRRVYYEDQTSDEMEDSCALVAAVMAGIPASNEDNHTIRRKDILVNITKFRRNTGLPEDILWSLPENRTPSWFFEHLLHQGAIYRNTNGSVHSPIPSFRAYLIEQGAEPRLTADRQDVHDAHTDPSP